MLTKVKQNKTNHLVLIIFIHNRTIKQLTVFIHDKKCTNVQKKLNFFYGWIIVLR